MYLNPYLLAALRYELKRKSRVLAAKIAAGAILFSGLLAGAYYCMHNVAAHGVS